MNVQAGPSASINAKEADTVHTGYDAIGYSAKSDIVPTLTHMWGGVLINKNIKYIVPNRL